MADEPVVQISTAVTIERGDPIPVDVDCPVDAVVLIDGEVQPSAGAVDTSNLEPGDHEIEVRCNQDTVALISATVFDQNARSSGGAASATVILLFVFLAAGVIVLTPSAGMAGLSLPKRR